MANLMYRRSHKPFRATFDYRQPEVTGKKILWFFCKVLLTALVMGIVIFGAMAL